MQLSRQWRAAGAMSSIAGCTRNASSQVCGCPEGRRRVHLSAQSSRPKALAVAIVNGCVHH